MLLKLKSQWDITNHPFKLAIIITVGSIKYKFLKTLELWHIAGRTVKWCIHFDKLFSSFYKVKSLFFTQ